MTKILSSISVIELINILNNDYRFHHIPNYLIGIKNSLVINIDDKSEMIFVSFLIDDENQQ